MTGAQNPEDRPHPVRDAYERFEAAAERFKRVKSRSDVTKAEAIQSLRNAAEDYYVEFGATLRAFNSAANWRRDGTPIEPLPRDIAFIAGQIVDDLLDGRAPTSIGELFFGPKRPGVGAIQRRAIEAAVRFVRAVRNDLIEFPHAVSYVAMLFEVDPRTVRRWVKDHPAEEIVVENLKASTNKRNGQRMLIAHLQAQAQLYKNRRHVKSRTGAVTRT